MQPLKKTDTFVSPAGGEIHYRAPDGELLRQVFVPAGIVGVAPYLGLCPVGAIMEIADGIEVVPARSAHSVLEPDGRYETGANPDFKPSSADPMMRKMQQTIAALQAKEAGREARMRALEKIEVVPKAAKQDKSEADLKPDSDRVE